MIMSNEIFKKIYEKAAVYSEEAYEANRRLENEVENRIAPHTIKLHGKEKEMLEDVFYDVCAEGKYVGFCIGMKYCFKLILELLSD